MYFNTSDVPTDNLIELENAAGSRFGENAQTSSSPRVTTAAATAAGQMKRRPHGSGPIIIVKQESMAASEDADRVSRGSHDDQLLSCDPKQTTVYDKSHLRAGEHVGGGSTSRLIQVDPPSMASRSTQQSTRVELNSPLRVRCFWFLRFFSRQGIIA